MGWLKGTAHMEAPSNGLLGNPCWHNHIKYASFILPFTVFIRPTLYLHFKYNNSNHFTLNQLNIMVCNFLCGLPHCLLNVTIKHFDDYNCAKCWKCSPNRTLFSSFWNGHVISPTTNHCTGKRTELRSCSAVARLDLLEGPIKTAEGASCYCVRGHAPRKVLNYRVSLRGALISSSFSLLKT